MFNCIQKCILIFSPAGPRGARLNQQRLSRRSVSWVLIDNILYILPLEENGWNDALSIPEYECGIKERVHLTFWPFSFQNCEQKNALLIWQNS